MRQITKDNFDNFLKMKGEFFVSQKHQVRPSAGFVGTTLNKIQKAHDHRALIEKILIVVYLFIPTILRQFWLFARRDYFAVGSWPLGKYIVSVYDFLIANSTGTYILILGVVSSVMFLWGFRIMSPGFKYIGNFFSDKFSRAKA